MNTNFNIFNKYLKKYKYPVLFLIFFCLLALRSWPQFISPQVWSEEGTILIPKFIDNGWRFLFRPLNDYFNTLPRIITAISLTISFTYYPIVSMVLSWIFIAFVGMAVVLSPTSLRYKFFCAVLIFLIPSEPEVFGKSLYIFWWSSILLFLLVLWDEKKSKLGLRIFYLIIGGLSSNIIILLLPLFYIRAWIKRNYKSEIIIALIASIIAWIQQSALNIVFNPLKENSSLIFKVNFIINKYFGNFVLGNLSNSKITLLVTGWIFFSLILFYVLKSKNIFLYFLLYLLLGSILLAIIRTHFFDIRSGFVGARYFFLPFILMYWLMLQIWHYSKLRIIILLIISISLLNMMPVRSSKPMDDLNWSCHVRQCKLNTKYFIPIQFDGTKKSAWKLELSGEKCKLLYEKDILVKIFGG